MKHDILGVWGYSLAQERKRKDRRREEKKAKRGKARREWDYEALGLAQQQPLCFPCGLGDSAPTALHTCIFYSRTCLAGPMTQYTI